MSALPTLDLHAHIDAAMEPRELSTLGAVFAVTRSLDEAAVAVRRTDPMTIWGVGCHPGLVDAQKQFSMERFAELVDTTGFVGEVGLDGKSRVPMATQVATLRSILLTLQSKPRLLTIHTFAATTEVLDLLAEVESGGAVLHWWLGSPEETVRATEVGCYFSVNAAMLNRKDALTAIPLERLLTETDHPFGDRGSRVERRPGAVADVERALAAWHGMPPDALRLQLWRNLRTLASAVGVSSLLPKELRRHLAAV